MQRFVFAAFGAACLASTSAADTAYLEPSSFSPELDETITIEAAFSDYCCVPKYPVRSDAYAIISPDGRKQAPQRIEPFATSTILEHTLTQPGTTRITTGERLGRMGEYVQLEGIYHLINSDDADPIDIPEGTPILSSQTATLSDAYVTVGEPSWASVQTKIGRLGLTPHQHPSTLQRGDTLVITVSFDGTPLAGQKIHLSRSGQRDRIGDHGQVLETDAKGQVAARLENRGTHLLMTRLQAPAPDGAKTDIRSYTTSLTFHVEG